MGNIGKPLRRITLVPMPDDVPVEEPSPKLPEREPELVPVHAEMGQAFAGLAELEDRRDLLRRIAASVR